MDQRPDSVRRSGKKLRKHILDDLRAGVRRPQNVRGSDLLGKPQGCDCASLVIFSSVQDHKAPVDLLEHENARHEMRESEVRELPADTRSSEKGRGRSQ